MSRLLRAAEILYGCGTGLLAALVVVCFLVMVLVGHGCATVGATRQMSDGEVAAIPAGLDEAYHWTEICCGCGLSHDVTVRVLPDGSAELSKRVNQQETERQRIRRRRDETARRWAMELRPQ